MRAAGTLGSLITLICNDGSRYSDTYYSDEWVAVAGMDLDPWLTSFRRRVAEGAWRDCLGSGCSISSDHDHRRVISFGSVRLVGGRPQVDG